MIRVVHTSWSTSTKTAQSALWLLQASNLENRVWILRFFQLHAQSWECEEDGADQRSKFQLDTSQNVLTEEEQLADEKLLSIVIRKQRPIKKALSSSYHGGKTFCVIYIDKSIFTGISVASKYCIINRYALSYQTLPRVGSALASCKQCISLV